MNAYSEDLRKKIVEAARTLGVSRPLAPKKRPGLKPKLDETARRLLEADLEEGPAATLRQRREFLRGAAGNSVSESSVIRALDAVTTGDVRGFFGHRGYRTVDQPL